MSRKVMIYTLTAIIISLIGCAKRNTALEDGANLTFLARVPVVGNPSELDVDETHAYVALDQGGLATISLSDYKLNWYPQMNSDDSSVTDFWRTRKLAVAPEHNRLLLNEIQFTDMIHIIDCSNPDSLIVIDAITGGTYDIQDIAIRELDEQSSNNVIELAFCSNVDLSYGLYDAEYWLGIEPGYPVTAPSLTAGVELDDAYLYGAAQQRGIVAYDKATKAFISELAVRGEAQKLVVRNGYAYIAARQGGLQIVDVSDIHHPHFVAEYITTGYASEVDYSNGMVAVSSGSGGCYVFDVTSPSNPRLMHRITECGYTNTVKFKDNKLIVGTRDNGVYIYEMS